MAVPDVSPQIIFSRTPLELTSGNFAVKAQVDTLMLRLVSIEIVSQCESFIAIFAAVRPGMGFVMATYVYQSALNIP